jgi:hypothetical protein
LGRAAFAATLAARTDGPIAGAKATLAWAGLELRDLTLWSLGGEEGICVLGATKHKLRGFVLKAIRARDLRRASRRSEQMVFPKVLMWTSVGGSSSDCPCKGCKKQPEQ